MKKKTEDRRVLRTRKLLQDALMSMMIEKGYEATTVQDIIDRANVGRATFYAHFADKKTLLASRIEDLRVFLTQQQRQKLAAAGGPDARALGFSLAMLEHAREHLPLWRSIAGRESGAFVVQRLHDMLADLVRHDLTALGVTRAAEHRDLLVQHLTGGFMAVLIWWLDHGARLTPEEVDRIYHRLVMPGLLPELRPRQERPS